MKHKIVYSKYYEVDIGPHVFITSKYRLIKERLINEKILKEEDFIEPTEAKDEDILLVHTREYLEKIKNVNLTTEEILQLEIPLTKEVSKGSIICCQGTILASEISLENKVGIHLGGGWHHAFSDHGEGFCVFNDLAIAIKKLKKENKIKKALVIDTDLHQGNGTAAIFKSDSSVFTFSIHEEDIYPAIKEKSSLDINLKPYTEDNEYISLLEKYLPGIVQSHKPEIIFYQAGSDPYFDDQLGNLRLTKEGLQQRDKIVRDLAKMNKIPIVVTLGGGYARKLTDTVDIHYNTVRLFLET